MKIIASDYDGTLNHGGITDVKRAAIKKWQDAGNVFAIVSGRGPVDALRIQTDDNLEVDYFIANNGAVIMTPDGKRVRDVRCDGSLAVPLLKLLFESGCTWAHVQTDFPCRVYADEKDCKSEGHYTLENMPTVSYFNQINTQLPDYDSSARVTAIVKEHFGEYLNPMQNGDCLDIIRADMDKAKGIYLLLDILGAKHEDVIAVGDNINDSAMIAEFRSYAMANGVDEIKNMADDVIDGITELIEKEI